MHAFVFFWLLIKHLLLWRNSGNTEVVRKSPQPTHLPRMTYFSLRTILDLPVKFSYNNPWHHHLVVPNKRTLLHHWSDTQKCRLWDGISLEVKFRPWCRGVTQIFHCVWLYCPQYGLGTPNRVEDTRPLHPRLCRETMVFRDIAKSFLCRSFFSLSSPYNHQNAHVLYILQIHRLPLKKLLGNIYCKLPSHSA